MNLCLETRASTIFLNGFDLVRTELLTTLKIPFAAMLYCKCREGFRIYCQATCLKHGADVLNEVQLLVAGGSPEVLAIVGMVFFFLLAFFFGKCLAALFLLFAYYVVGHIPIFRHDS